MMKTLAIIGGGASGMAAAIETAKRGLSVTVFEKKEQVGKKLSATGNGHCNFTNSLMESECYRSHDMSFVLRFLYRFGVEDMLSAMRDLMLLYTERGGYYYPLSNQASSVVSALSDRMKELGVKVKADSEVNAVIPVKGGGFRVRYGNTEELFDLCLLAMGSGSGVKDRKAFRGYDFLKSLGHHVYEPLPSLVPLKGSEGFEKDWAGVRTKAAVTFGGQTETGELQFTEEGISGIPVFQISHRAVEVISGDGKADLTIDLLPDADITELNVFFDRGLGDSLMRERRTEDILKGLLPKKLILPVLKKAGVYGGKSLASCSGSELDSLKRTLKAFVYRTNGYGDFLSSQVTNGGLDLLEITDDFESKLCPGLFVTGELLDIDGLCGGYNLHFAFGSGLLAGRAMSGRQEDYDTE